MPKRCFSHSKTQWKNGEFRPPLFPLVFALGGVRLVRPQNDDFRPGSTTKQPEISGLRGRCHPQVLRASYEDPRGDSAPQTLKLGVRRPFTHKLNLAWVNVCFGLNLAWVNVCFGLNLAWVNVCVGLHIAWVNVCVGLHLAWVNVCVGLHIAWVNVCFGLDLAWVNVCFGIDLAWVNVCFGLDLVWVNVCYGLDLA